MTQIVKFKPKPIDKIADLGTRFDELNATANLISPVASVDHIMPMHQVSLRVVKLDPNERAGDVYVDPRFCKAGEVALTKNGLSKLMAAAGVQIVAKRRLDDRSDPHYCEIEVVLALRDFDGGWRQVIATKEMDLRNGAPETLKPEKDQRGNKTGNLVPYEDTALADKRRHIQSHAETKAIERALRLVLSLKQKYSAQELAKPFVVPKLVAALDPDDPEQKAALIQHALAGESALFGQPPTPRTTTLLSAPASAAVTEPEWEPEPEPDAPPPYAPEPEQAGTACECDCGCGAPMSPERIEATKTRMGKALCSECYPGGRWYDATKHAEVTR